MYFFLRYTLSFLVHNPSPLVRSPLSVTFLLVLWLLIVVEFVLLRLAVSILFRSLCTEENVYSIEPIYPPTSFLYHMYMHIMILNIVEANG